MRLNAIQAVDIVIHQLLQLGNSLLAARFKI